ncbi:MAG TPA: hypothetical protein VGL72_05700 [Bryobacteraceae bacterium]|jgi:hypothetical protein
MKLTLIAATLLLAFSAAGAQPPLPQLRVEPTAGGSIFYVKNVTSQPLTAFIIELVDYPGSFYALVQDEITSEPIAPDKEKRIPINNMTVGAVPDYVKVRAAIYADGSTAGLPDRVTLLTGRRVFSLTTVQDLIRRTELAQTQNASKDVAAAALRRSAEFMVLAPGSDKMSQASINQAAGRQLFTDTAEYLDKHSIDETLTKLHEWEKALTNSKPTIQR